MEVGEAQRLLGAVMAIDVACAERAAVAAGVGDLRRLQSFLEGRAVAFASRLAQVTAAPEQVMADAGRTSTRDAERVLERAEVTPPPLSSARRSTPVRSARSMLMSLGAA